MSIEEVHGVKSGYGSVPIPYRAASESNLLDQVAIQDIYKRNSFNACINKYFDKPSEKTFRSLVSTTKKLSLIDHPLFQSIYLDRITDQFQKKAASFQGIKNSGIDCWLISLMGFLLTPAAAFFLEKELVLGGPNERSLQRDCRELRNELNKRNPSERQKNEIFERIKRNPLFGEKGLVPGRRQEDAQEGFIRIFSEAFELANDPRMGFRSGSVLSPIKRRVGIKPHVKLEEPLSSTLTLRMPTQGRVDIQDLIFNYFEPESREYRFEDSYDREQAQVRSFITPGDETGISPELICLNLPRFANNLEKNELPVEGLNGPLFVPLRNNAGEMIKTSVYVVSTILFHHGGSLKGGHYTALYKNHHGRWEHRNDSRVTLLSDKEAHAMMRKDPYQVFIKKIKEEL